MSERLSKMVRNTKLEICIKYYKEIFYQDKCFIECYIMSLLLIYVNE